MPKVSEFYGIQIRINYREHPPPHFHAYYGSDAASIQIDDGEVYRGWLPPGTMRLIREWWEQHQQELYDNWERAERKEPLLPIDPLT